MTENEKKIFGSLFKDDEAVQDRRAYFDNEIGVANAYEDVSYVFYTVIHNTGQKIPKYTKVFIEMFLKTQKAILSKSPYIDCKKYSEDEDKAYEDFSTMCLQEFESCKNFTVTDDEFVEAVEIHKMYYVQYQGTQLLEKSSEILNEGLKIGYKTYTGYQDMKDYLYKNISNIDNLLNRTKSKGCVVYGIDDDVSTDYLADSKPLCGFGVEDLDKHLLIYPSNLVNIMAPSKCGKSRFCMQIAVKACLQGVNVAVWSLENGFYGAEAMFRARLFIEHLKKDGKVLQNSLKDVVISDSAIRKKQLPTKILEQEETCWSTFKIGVRKGIYGKFCNIEEAFTFDNYLEVVERYTNKYNIQLWIIDYYGLMTGGMRGKGKTTQEILAEAYKETKNYLNQKKIAMIIPSQCKQEVVEALGRMKDDDLANVDLRTAAGLSYEVIKTPDINLFLYATMTDLKAQKEKILYVPSRECPHFAPVLMRVDLGTCNFMSVNGY